jgi:glycolate oxidase FAD binding subunit
MRVLKPDTEVEVVEAIRDAGGPVVVEGRGTKLGIGRPANADTVLRLAGLSGIAMYEPDEMVFSVCAGTPLTEVEAALAAKGQCLGFEPGDIAKLWGEHADSATIGGTIAAAIAGPRRFAAGAARDHLLGFTAVNGKGERFKAGGRVVKNVTGYDLPKLAAGSFGTLFVMTELTLRALPRGSATAVLAVPTADAAAALALLRAVARSPFEPSGLAYLPKEVAARIGAGDEAQALIRLEGHRDGVTARGHELTRTLAPQARTLEPEEGIRRFRAVSDLHPLFNRDAVLWRVSVPPTAASDVVARLAPDSWVADGAGGTLWLAFVKSVSIPAVHAAARDAGGHATLIRKGLTQTDHVFPPLDTAALALTTRVKLAFDPARNLNPGRMYKDV